MSRFWKEFKYGFNRGVADFFGLLLIALSLTGLAATLGVMFRIFKWAAGL